mmetsp:Transcript_35686/g.88821  ORF Transcript_35686/g.88821 Transcript_35686/m.88821 type:complete len:173 (+) Transcript_35686:373-891(+)
MVKEMMRWLVQPATTSIMAEWDEGEACTWGIWARWGWAEVATWATWEGWAATTTKTTKRRAQMITSIITAAWAAWGSAIWGGEEGTADTWAAAAGWAAMGLVTVTTAAPVMMRTTAATTWAPGWAAARDANALTADTAPHTTMVAARMADMAATGVMGWRPTPMTGTRPTNR